METLYFSAPAGARPGLLLTVGSSYSLFCSPQTTASPLMELCGVVREASRPWSIWHVGENQTSRPPPESDFRPCRYCPVQLRRYGRFRCSNRNKLSPRPAIRDAEITSGKFLV